MPPIHSLRSIALSFGGRPVFQDVTVHIQPGERIALVGRNGSGKSTLLKIIAGQIEPDTGDVYVEPGLDIAYLPQDPDFAGHETVRDFVGAGLQGAPEHERFKIDAALSEVDIDGAMRCAALSGGEARRAALARVFLDDPDLLLLDEPTNHLDLPTIEWLEGRLAGLRGAVLTISHDRRFLANVSRTTLWLDRGRIRRLDDSFARFDEWSEQVIEQEAQERARLAKKIASETEWAQQGMKARRKRNQGRLRRLEQLRQERARQIKLAGQAKVNLDQADPSGRMVIKAINIAKSYGARTIIEDFSTQILRGDRIGVLGPNGAGKTTLVKILMGQVKPDRGKIRLGTNLEPIFIDQKREGLDLDRTVQQTLCGDTGDHLTAGGRTRHVLGYLRDFLFEPRQAQQPVKALSGGERSRLLMARELAKPSNLLVLDEPTNDLDMDTLDLLQDLLDAYEGTVLLVSHDRDFLDRTATSTIVMEGDSTVREYPGGYTTYLEQRPATRHAKAAENGPAKPRGGAGKGATGSTGTSSAAAQSSSGKKLSFKEKHALETLPDRIAEKERQIAEFEAALAEPELYQRDPEGAAKIVKALQVAQDQLETMENEWLELSEKAET